MIRTFLSRWGLPAVAGVVLCLTAGQVFADGPGYVGDYWRNLGPYTPGYYGYPLDDYSAGYYGGSRYTQYYGFGRGYGWAEYPGWYMGRCLPPDYRGSPKHAPVIEEPEGPHGPVIHELTMNDIRANQPALMGPPLPTEPAAAPAQLIVAVPSGAEIWLEGAKTQKTGAVRTFESPPLTASLEYSYQVRARWIENGREVEQTRKVMVHAGEKVNVSFPPAQLPANSIAGGR